MANSTAPLSPPPIISTVFTTDTFAGIGITSGLQFDGTQSFSLGAWLWAAPGAAAGDLFSSGDTFVVSLTESATIQITLGTASWAPANLNFPLSSWTYLLLTVAVDGSSATVSLYLNGAMTDTTTLAISDAIVESSMTEFSIGGAGFQCLAVNIRNVALVADAEQYITPDWTIPAGTANIVAALDFSQVPPADEGPNNYSISYTDTLPSQLSNTPGLYFNGAANATLTSTGTVVASGTYSLGLWCNVAAVASAGDPVTILQASDSEGLETLTIGFTASDTSDVVDIFVTVTIAGVTCQTNTYAMPLQTWSAIGVTYDGNKIWMSYNQLGWVATVDCNLEFDDLLPLLTLGSNQANTQNFTGYIQNFFSMNGSLTSDQIYATLTSTQISQPCVCILQFNGPQTLDQVTGATVVQNQAVWSNQLSTWPVDSQGGQALVRPTRRRPTGPITLLPALHRIPSLTSSNPDTQAYNLEIFDQLLSTLEGEERKSKLRQHFKQKLKEGFDRAKTGDWVVPMVQCEKVNGKYRYTLSKPFVENDVLEVEQSGFNDCTAWIIQFVAQCICIILYLFGCAYVLSGILRPLFAAARSPLIQYLFVSSPGRTAYFLVVLNEAEDVSGSLVIKILQGLYQSNLLVTSITNGLAGISWWRWAFTVAWLVISIAALFVSGGWYLTIMLAQLAVSIGQLVVLWNRKPSGC